MQHKHMNTVDKNQHAVDLNTRYVHLVVCGISATRIRRLVHHRHIHYSE